MAEGERWHLSKSVPISIIFFMIAQTIAVIIWGVRLDGRVGALEKTDAQHEQKIGILEAAKDKLILIEERQNNVIRTLDMNGHKLDTIIDATSKR